MGIAQGTGDVIAEIDTTGETPVPHYYIANHRGDTVMTLVGSGAIDSFWQYDAFGAVLTNCGTFTPTYTFSTKEPIPELNAMLYAYRLYLIDCARWNQRDPIGYQDSANLYQFCGNNSVINVDAQGLDYSKKGNDDAMPSDEQGMAAYNASQSGSGTPVPYDPHTDTKFRDTSFISDHGEFLAVSSLTFTLGLGVMHYAIGAAGYTYLVNGTIGITTVLGSCAACSAYFGLSGYNVLNPNAEVSVLQNARFIVEAVKRGDAFLFLTDPVQHARLMNYLTETSGHLYSSRYLWLEIPMLNARGLAAPQASFR